jgi:hypothetical protein
MHGRASRTAGYPLPRCRKAGRGARMPICCGAQWCGLELMSSARAKRRASQHRDRIAGMTPTKPSAPGPGSAHQPRPNPMVCGVEQPRWRADLTALPALSVVHWHGSSSGGSRRPLPLCTTAAATCHWRSLQPRLNLASPPWSPQSSWCKKCLRRSVAFSTVLSG